MSVPKTVSELYPSQWIHASDLKGKSYTLTITAVEVRKFKWSKNPDQWRVVVTFEEARKQLICNKTQANAIARIAGDHIKDWPGTTIGLKPGLARNLKQTIMIEDVRFPDPDLADAAQVAPAEEGKPAAEEVDELDEWFGPARSAQTEEE